MFKKTAFYVAMGLGLGAPSPVLAANAAGGASSKGATLFQMISSGGVSMLFLGLLSVAVVSLIIYHFLYVRVEKLVPQDMAENVLALVDRKEYDKALAVCRQQPNLISAIALKGLEKISRGGAVVQEAILFEGKSRIERLWQNLTYLGDLAVIAPMVGLLGTIIGMIEAFNYFRGGSINPAVLTQGLAKAMVNTAVGLFVAVPAMIAYSYFRGRISLVTSTAEAIASEMAQTISRHEPGRKGS